MNNDRKYIRDIDQKYPHFLYEYPTTFSMNQSDQIEYLYYTESLVSIQEESLLYIHIPFCYKICSFCNIYTTPLTERGDIIKYIKRIFQELENIFFHLSPLCIKGIYIGWGTPTVLNSDQFQELFEFLDSKIGNISSLYIEIDAHPSTITREHINIFHQFWVKQLAIGIQSLDPVVLKILNRHHQSYDMLKKVGSYLQDTNIKIHVDFVIWLPHENLDNILRGIDMTYSLLRFTSVSINRYDNTKDTELYKIYAKFFNSKLYQKQTNMYIDLVITYVSKKYGIIRNLTSYFEWFRKKHMNVIWIGSWSYSFIRWRWFFQNQHYLEYIHNAWEFIRTWFKDIDRDDERRMYTIHNCTSDSFFEWYMALFWNSFEEDFPVYDILLKNMKENSMQKDISSVDFYSSRITQTYENERIS